MTITLTATEQKELQRLERKPVSVYFKAKAELEAARDAAVAEATKLKGELATANAEVARLKRQINPPAPAQPADKRSLREIKVDFLRARLRDVKSLSPTDRYLIAGEIQSLLRGEDPDEKP